MWMEDVRTIGSPEKQRGINCTFIVRWLLMKYKDVLTDSYSTRAHYLRRNDGYIYYLLY
jgi:hypothetical protein